MSRIKRWAGIAFGQIALTFVVHLLLRRLPAAVLENAVTGWIDDQIAQLFGITAPTAQQVYEFIWNWVVPFLLVALGLYVFYRVTAKPKQIASARQQEPETIIPVPAPSTSSQQAADPHPHWPIAELFSYINPDVLERQQDSNLWEKVGNDIRDKLALGKLAIWGRPIDEGVGTLLGERQVLRKIEPTYWHSAHFTYSFFDSTAGDAVHTYATSYPRVEYTDLQVNRAQATAIWIPAAPPTPQRPMMRGFRFEGGKLTQPPLTPEEIAFLQPFPDAIFVYDIQFQTADLESKGLVHINVEVFNGSGERIFLAGIDGNISVKFKDGPANAAKDVSKKLPRPYFFEPTQNEFDPYNPFSFILVQALPPELVTQLVNWPDNSFFIFDFESLDVTMQATNNAKKRVRLSLWDQAQLYKVVRIPFYASRVETLRLGKRPKFAARQ